MEKEGFEAGGSSRKVRAQGNPQGRGGRRTGSSRSSETEAQRQRERAGVEPSEEEGLVTVAGEDVNVVINEEDETEEVFVGPTSESWYQQYYKRATTQDLYSVLLEIRDGIYSQKGEGTTQQSAQQMKITPTIQDAIDSLSDVEYNIFVKNIEAVNSLIRDSLSYSLQIDATNIYRLSKQLPWVLELYKIQLKRIDEYNSNLAVLGNGGGFDYETLYLPIPTRNVKVQQKTAQQLNLLPENTLAGTKNVVFTKLRNQKPNSYEEQIGDYTRTDMNIPPCKLRFNPTKKYQFYVSQVKDGKNLINYFPFIGDAITFCIRGGFYADFIRANTESLYEKQTKRKYPEYNIQY